MNNNNYWLNLTNPTKSPVKKTRKNLEKERQEIKKMTSKFGKPKKPNVHPNNKPESKTIKLNKKKFT